MASSRTWAAATSASWSRSRALACRQAATARGGRLRLDQAGADQRVEVLLDGGLQVGGHTGQGGPREAPADHPGPAQHLLAGGRQAVEAGGDQSLERVGDR